MFVRLALESDIDAFLAMAVANVRETLPGEPVDEDVLRETFWSYIRTASPTIFVVDDRRAIVGMLMADIARYDYRDGFYAYQRVLYVSPEKRGTRAAVLLVKTLMDWAARLGAVEVLGGNDNSFRSERTASFLEHFGFRKVGYALAKRLKENDHGTAQA